MRTVLAIDAGGSSTRAVLVDESGQVLGLGRAPQGNPISAGMAQATASMVTATRDACAGNPAPELLMLTMAGGGVVGGRLPGLAEALAAADIHTPYAIEGDALSTYFSGTTETDGGAIIAGTGSTGAAVAGGQIVHVVDGAGWLIGDDGAGFWIGRRVVHDVLAAIDGRGPHTTLVDRLMADLPEPTTDVMNARDVPRIRLVEHAYGLRPVELARYAPLAFAEAAHDAVAATILDDATAHLVRLADVVMAKAPEGPVVLAGGVASSLVGDRVAAHLGERARRARDGSVGAAVLGLRRIGVDVDEAVRMRIADTLAAWTSATRP